MTLLEDGGLLQETKVPQNKLGEEEEISIKDAVDIIVEALDFKGIIHGSSSSSATEYTVRVPKNTSKKYNIMAFNSGDRVNCSTWTQARMERDMSARRIYGEEEAADGAAGSEFGKKQREEARRKKYGIVKREFKVEDQSWVLKVNGKAGKGFKGVKKGGVTENASYYIFTQCPDGAFEAFPVNGWLGLQAVAAGQ